MVLPDASCKVCAAMTSKTERTVLRGFMYEARVVGNFPSRRKKHRPRVLNTKLVNHDGDILEHSIPIEDAAAFLVLPKFARAAILSNEAPVKGITLIGQETLHFGTNVNELVRKRDAKGIQFTSTIHPVEFAKLVAKIAYGYLVAEIGVFPREETPLLKLVRGECDDIGNWIGSHKYVLDVESKKPKHALGIVVLDGANNTRNYIVQVKLFSDTGVTGYEVAARIPGWQQYVR